MFVRVNVPDWGPREIGGGIAAAMGGGHGARRALRRRVLGDVGDRHVEFLASARAGIVRAVQVLGLHGTRIAVPAYVCPAVLTALLAEAVVVVAVDCDQSTLDFDAAALGAAARAGEVQAVLAPSAYGRGCDHGAIEGCGLPWIEDAAYHGGQPIRLGAPTPGLRGSAGVWSFNFKTLAAVGGGVAFLPRPCPPTGSIDGAVPRARSHERSAFANYALRAMGRQRIPRSLPGAGVPRLIDEHPPIRASLARLPLGPMSDLQASVALAQWDRREELAARSRRNSSLLAEVVRRSSVLTAVVPERSEGSTAYPHLYPMLLAGQVSEPELRVHALRTWLHRDGVQTEDPYPLAAGPRSAFPNADRLRRRLLLVPCHPSLSAAVMERVAASLECASRRLESGL